MPGRTRTGYGHVAETVGWQKMMRWLAATGVDKKKRTVSDIAKMASVTATSAHAWRWRDAKPTTEAIRAMKPTLKASEKDWETEVEAVSTGTEG